MATVVPDEEVFPLSSPASLSKEVASQLIKGARRNSSSAIKENWKKIQEFILIKDKLQMHRIEWILGVPQLNSKKNYQRNNQVEFGLDCVTYINQEAYKFKSGVARSQGDAKLTDLYEECNKRIEFTIKGIFYIISSMLRDETVMRYIYECPGPTY